VPIGAIFRATAIIEGCGKFLYSGQYNDGRKHADLFRSMQRVESYRGIIIIKKRR
jgi:hypothetical protein